MMRSRGFTLLELIVVIAIFGVMSAMAYGGLSSVLKTRVHVEQSLERTAEYQKAFMRLRNDFQNARYRPVRDPYGVAQPAFIGDNDSHVTLTHGGWRNPLSQPRASLERINYYLDKDKKALIRGSYRVLDQSQDSKPVEVTLLDRVTDLSWRYLDNKREWQTLWPPTSVTGGSTGSSSGTSLPAPPMAVEMTLTTEDLGEIRFLFRLGMDPWPQGFQPGAANSTGTGGGTGTGTGNGNANGNTATDNGNPGADVN